MIIGVLLVIHNTLEVGVYVFVYVIEFNRAPVRYVTKTWSIVLLTLILLMWRIR